MSPTKNANNTAWNSPRWKGITRPYTHADVDRLKGTVTVEYSLARAGAERFWKLLRSEPFIPALGAVNGNQAVEMAEAGLKAVYLSDCPLTSGNPGTYGVQPPQAHPVPGAVRAVNSALLRADQVSHSRRQARFDWMLPIVAEGDTEFGGSMSSFESTKALIEAGAAAIHFDDQLPATRRCGQIGGKVLIPMEEAIQKLVAARLAADTLGVPTVIIARTDADSASYLSSGSDRRDQPFLTGEISPGYNGSYNVFRGGMDAAIARALAFAPYADMLWCETADLNKEDARKFANAIHAQFPGKMLAYNCSPSFHWRAKMNEDDLACFQRDLAAMGYRFQFISLAGYHTLNLSMYQFAKDYAQSGMTAYSQIQQLELEMAKQLGHSAVGTKDDVGTDYFEAISSAITHTPRTDRRQPRPRVHEHFEVDTLDYNDGEATERTPMPHLYPSLEPTQLPMAAAAD